MKFIAENAPEHFFSDQKDDGKADYHVAVVGSRDSLKEFTQKYGNAYMVEADLDDRMVAGKYVVRSPRAITEMEGVDRTRLERALRKIYDARSRLIHEGIRLPKSIVFGLFRGLLMEALAEMQESKKSHMKIPPLLTFERLVSYSMAEFLSKQK